MGTGHYAVIKPVPQGIRLQDIKPHANKQIEHRVIHFVSISMVGDEFFVQLGNIRQTIGKLIPSIAAKFQLPATLQQIQLYLIQSLIDWVHVYTPLITPYEYRLQERLT